MLTTQFDLLKRLGGVPLDELVDALRDIHRNGADSREHLTRLLTPPSGAGAGAASASANPPNRPIELAQDVDYEVARRHFIDHGRRLREQALLAERLLERFARPTSGVSPAALGHDLTLAGPRDGIASTRFVLVNRESEPMAVRFAVDRAELDPGGLGARLRFDPESPVLQSGDELDVRLSADLTGWRPSDRPEVGVDVWNGEHRLVRLWIHADPPGQEHGHASPE